MRTFGSGGSYGAKPRIRAPREPGTGFVIVVTVELWPGGDKSRAQVLGRAAIINEGTGTLSRGTYAATFSDKAGRLWRAIEVRGFPRKRLLAWDLLYRALRDAVGERNR